MLRSSLSEDVTIEKVRDVWSKVVDMSTADRVNSATEATSTLVELLDALDPSNRPNSSSSNQSGDDKLDEFIFCNKDLILYALGGKKNCQYFLHQIFFWRDSLIVFIFDLFAVGASVKDSVDLKFLYENHPEFSPLPSYFILPGLMLQMASNMVSSAVKHTEVELSQILHGEQYLEIFDELPTEGTLKTTGNVIDVIDKRSGAVVIANCMY